MEQAWELATHCIGITNHDGSQGRIFVRIEDMPGPAYTREEWDSETAADWEIDEDGDLTWQGGAPGWCRNYTLTRIA